MRSSMVWTASLSVYLFVARVASSENSVGQLSRLVESWENFIPSKLFFYLWLMIDLAGQGSFDAMLT